MDTAFDPYYKWLAIPPKHQPADHYRLLGIAALESDLDVIANAADQRMAHVRTFQMGQHAADSQKILNELSTARVCLLDPERKSRYDAQLRQRNNEVTAAPPPRPARAASPSSFREAFPFYFQTTAAKKPPASNPPVPVCNRCRRRRSDRMDLLAVHQIPIAGGTRAGGNRRWETSAVT